MKIIALVLLLLFILWNGLFGRFWRRRKTETAMLLRRIAWAGVLVVLGIAIRAQIQLLAGQATVEKIVYASFIGMMEIVLISQWIVIPLVQGVRHRLRR